MPDYQKICRELPEAVILTDKTHKVISFNAKAAELFAVTKQEPGQQFLELFGCPQIFSLLEEAVMLLRTPKLTYENSTIMLNMRGEKRFFKASVVPLMTAGGSLETVITTLSDITILKEIEKLKTDFFATVSHELRTPLTSILMGVGMMKTGHLGKLSLKGKEILQALEEDCNRLLRLVDNLLDLSRMEAGNIPMETENVDVNRMVGAALGTLKLQAEARKVALRTKVPFNLPTVKVDANKIIWVLTNLVGNALRYTAEGGSITVQTARKGTKLFFSVQDTGRGIPVQYQEKIFKKFVQVKDGEPPSGGAGLGLTICKEIVEAHGGEIWVNSEVGKGSTFTFSIPVSRS